MSWIAANVSSISPDGAVKKLRSESKKGSHISEKPLEASPAAFSLWQALLAMAIKSNGLRYIFECECAKIEKIGLDAEGKVMPAAHKTYVERREGGYWITGTRISLDSVIYAYQCGAAPESIQRSYPLLTLEEVYGTIAFYLGNQQEIDAYLKQSEAEGTLAAEKMKTSFRANNPALVKRLEKARRSRGDSSS